MELREGQRATVSANLKTAQGHQAAFQEGTAVWESSDPDVLSVTVDPADELSAVIQGLNGEDNTGVVVTFTIDGDPDEGEDRPIVGTLDCVVTQGEATVVELTAGAPEDVTTGGATPAPTEEPA